MGKPDRSEEIIGLGQKRKAVFLDRDGVVNHAIVRDGKPYPPKDISELAIIDGAHSDLLLLKERGYVIVIVTNQPDVGRGTMQRETVEEVNSHLRSALPIDRIEVCYHPGRGLSDCDCRKPKPGLVLRAAQELGLELDDSWMVGDRWSDIECGDRAGLRTILIGDGYGEPSGPSPDHMAAGLKEAVSIIINSASIRP